MSNFIGYEQLVGEVKDRALCAGLGHVCSSFNESIDPQKIIDEMREYYREDDFSIGCGVSFMPCEQYETTPWSELADIVELIARDLYEFACAMYESMPQCSERGVHLFQDMCTVDDVLQFDAGLTWEQCDEIAGEVFRSCDADVIGEAVFLATNQEDEDE